MSANQPPAKGNNAHRPIIIIKRPHAEHDDHGGQWKIAYADFVTAMMAFFLVMWLLSSTTETQREGVARFFNTSSLLDLNQGDGMLEGGRSVLAGESRQERIAISNEDGGLNTDGEGSANNEPTPDRDARLNGLATTAPTSSNPQDHQRMEALKAELERMTSQANGELRDFASNIHMEAIPEGLRIAIFDRDSTPMFSPGSVEPTPRLARILSVVGGVLVGVPNPVTVSGHTDSQPYSRTGNQYTNWELSSDRAGSARRHLARAGLRDQRFLRVEGRGAADPLLPDNTEDPRNRRVSITVLRENAAAAQRSAPFRRAAPPASTPPQAVPASRPATTTQQPTGAANP